MEQLKTRQGKGLNGWQIKMIAVLFMTIDHLGAYGFEIPVFNTHYSKLRLLGRIAMPLFLFMLTEGLRYTRSRPKFLLRLYLGAVWTGLFVTVTNFFFKNTIGQFVQSNILFTYFFIALYVTLLEKIGTAARIRDWKQILLGVGGIAVSFLPALLGQLLLDLDLTQYGIRLEYAWLINDIICSLVAFPLNVEYTWLIVLMGILMYFAGTKQKKAAVLGLFSVFCYLGARVPALYSSSISLVLGYPQYYMILAVPFILLYNGRKGRSDQYFFYLYYPLHRYAISIAVYIYQLFCSAPL